MANETLSALKILKESLQLAATMCGPQSHTPDRFEESNFDIADLEDEDTDQCVGVDLRAEQLEANLFLVSDEVDWHSNALWLLSKEQSIDFLSNALYAHLAPIYMPFAPITAKFPDEIIPEETKEDIQDLMQRFVNENLENTMSVQDVKDSLSAGILSFTQKCRSLIFGCTVLGEDGLALLPHEFPIFDAYDFRGLSSIFKDSEDDWADWFASVDEESDEDVSVDDEVCEIVLCVSIGFNLLIDSR